LVIISLLAAPGRGLIADWHRRRKSHRRLRLEGVLTDLFELEQQHTAVSEHGHTAQAIRAMSFGEGGSVLQSLRALEARGLVQRVASDGWIITDSGRSKVKRMLANMGRIDEHAR
jgi:DNA-binding GntR family transcriptional regulator